MLHRSVLLTLLISLNFAAAADPTTVVDSAEPILGALGGLPKVQSNFVGNYIPGYGFQANGLVSDAGFGDDVDIQEIISSVSGVLTGLAPTVQGLESGDWVSLSFEAGVDYVTIRLKPTAANSLEVFVNGERR